MSDPLKYPPVDRTAHFQFFAKASLGEQGAAIVGTLKSTCELDYVKIRDIFNRSDPLNLPFRIIIDETDDGAHHGGCADVEIYIGLNPSLKSKYSDAKMAEVYRLMLIAEVVEVFEAMTENWNCGYSPGEALSRVLALEYHPGGEFNSTAAIWLNSNPRQNWIDEVDPEDDQAISIGCSVLFLSWMRQVEGFSWSQIISADQASLGKMYEKLTGQNNAWARFSSEMAVRWPPGAHFDVKTDQPFG